MAVDRRWLFGVLAAILSAGCNGSMPTSTLDAQPTLVTTTITNPTSETRTEASEPIVALEAFLQAEIDGDFDVSFHYLTHADQTASGGVGSWTADHLFVLPTIGDYSILTEATDAGRTEVTADLVLKPGLDQLTGLTTSSADSTWVLVEENSTWAVALTQSNIEPVYLDERSASAAVARWVEERQACVTPLQWDQALLGFPALADDLCGANGAIAVGAPEPLSDAAESGPFLAAFGAEVGLWARVVPIDSPADLRVVVAPIGEQWLVIGVLDSTS